MAVTGSSSRLVNCIFECSLNERSDDSSLIWIGMLLKSINSALMSFLVAVGVERWILNLFLHWKSRNFKMSFSRAHFLVDYGFTVKVVYIVDTSFIVTTLSSSCDPNPPFQTYSRQNVWQKISEKILFNKSERYFLMIILLIILNAKS